MLVYDTSMFMAPGKVYPMYIHRLCRSGFVVWLRGEKIIIYGDGKQTMDMIFGADIGRANVAAIDNEDCKNMFINVGTGLQTSVIESIGYDFSIDMIEIAW